MIIDRVAEVCAIILVEVEHFVDWSLESSFLALLSIILVSFSLLSTPLGKKENQDLILCVQQLTTSE